ncbi:MAG TPA: hypothetical protein VMA37_11715 [Acetobacteraceae bacterium]|nr:hypothetical protein [Acetobacteraceae bacterium]
MFLRRNTAIALWVIALLVASSGANAQVAVKSRIPGYVWTYRYPGSACVADDFPDVPARPFIVGPRDKPTILWFASNSSGFYASRGAGADPERLAKLQRIRAGTGCVSWLPRTNYPASNPATYNTGLWMVAPWAHSANTIYALVHNEFHGEWTGNSEWCAVQQQGIYLPCDYWNLVGAASTDGGRSFRLLQAAHSPGFNVPAIALGEPYTVPPSETNPLPTNLPQGMTAQSNIIRDGDYYYVLIEQLLYQPPDTTPPEADGVCIFRARMPEDPDATAPTWKGWDGSGYTIPAPSEYPEGTELPPCTPVLGAQFRFSWSSNQVLHQFIILGQDQLSRMGQNHITTVGCQLAPKVSSGTADAAIVYVTAKLDQDGHLAVATGETCLLLINSIANWQQNRDITGQSYPSLLDPIDLAPWDVPDLS